jgi:hypothetical protein
MLAVLLVTVASPVLAAIRTVNCTTGGTITQALSITNPGDTIRIKGTCTETVTLTRDDLTLEGKDAAIIDGQGGEQAVITVDGARRVTLNNLTVQNGAHGILARRGATVRLTGIIARNNTTQGIRIDDNTSATFQGTISSRNNGHEGIIILNNANAHFDRATVQTTRNGSAGVNILWSASAAFLHSTFTSTKNIEGLKLQYASTITITNSDLSISQNAGTGFFLSQNATADFFDGNLSVTNNTGHGINPIDGARVRLFGARLSERPSLIEIKDNTRDGLNVARAAEFATFSNRPQVTVMITGNDGHGIRADDGAIVGLNDSTVTGNTTSDVDASFGSRLTFNNNTIGSISCDLTVLSRGSTLCP